MEEELKTIETVDTSPFKHLVMTLGELPTSFVDSMTYYECLAWLVNFIQNTVIPTVNNNAEAVEELQTAFTTLKNYVDTYFDNLDVQDEINNKLDQMAEDGTLQEILYNYFSTSTEFIFNNVSELKNATNLVNGSKVKTLGYYTPNDGGESHYIVEETGTHVANDRDIIAIGTDLVAIYSIDREKINIKQFGAKGDRLTDDSVNIQATIDFAMNHNITNVYVPKGEYLISTPIVLYDFINLKGYKRELTKIYKTGHLTDSVYNKDCVLTAVQRDDSTLNYPRYITIENIALEAEDRSDQPAYGLYLYMSAFITIKQFASRYCGDCMNLGNLWLSTVEEVSTGYGTIGIHTTAGTTLALNDCYTAENSMYGYELDGLTYCDISNLACDSAPNSIAYYFYYSNISLTGIGCEAENYNTAIKLFNSQINMNNAHIRINISDSSSTVISLQNSLLSTDNLFIGKDGQTGVAAGKFLSTTGNGSNLQIKTLTVFPSGFATANAGNDFNSVTVIDKNNFSTTVLGNTRGFIGSKSPNYDETINLKKLNIAQLNAQLSSPCCDDVKKDYNNTDIAWGRDDRPIASIIPNAGLNKSGSVMFVKKSYGETAYLQQPISTVTLSNDKLVLAFTALTLDAAPEAQGITINSNWKARIKGSSDTPKAITSVDYDNNTITVNTSTGYQSGDYVELLPPRDVRDCAFIPVQGILSGATSARPTAPKAGTMFYDTTIHKPIWWNGSNWKDVDNTTV